MTFDHCKVIPAQTHGESHSLSKESFGLGWDFLKGDKCVLFLKALDFMRGADA
jgi:hypothetical protein